MTPVPTIPADRLRTRTGEIRRLLCPLSSDPRGPACRPGPATQGILFGAFGPGPAHGPVRDWRFRTSFRSYFGNYFEHWLPSGNATDEHVLERAYLTIYRTERTESGIEKEIVGLHCDPTIPAGAPFARYKRGPHLHLKEAKAPLPRAHIALNLLSLDRILTSVDELAEALSSGIDLVREELLGRYEEPS